MKSFNKNTDASGGMRLGIRDGASFDSFWLSDNQSPYESMRILKDTLLRSDIPQR